MEMPHVAGAHPAATASCRTCIQCGNRHEPPRHGLQPSPLFCSQLQVLCGSEEAKPRGPTTPRLHELCVSSQNNQRWLALDARDHRAVRKLSMGLEPGHSQHFDATKDTQVHSHNTMLHCISLRMQYVPVGQLYKCSGDPLPMVDVVWDAGNERQDRCVACDAQSHHFAWALHFLGLAFPFRK